MPYLVLLGFCSLNVFLNGLFRRFRRFFHRARRFGDRLGRRIQIVVLDLEGFVNHHLKAPHGVMLHQFCKLM